MARDPQTQALRDAVKAEVVPFMRAIGFKRHGKSFAARPIDGSFGNCYWRTRGPYVDEINIQWDAYGRPRFVLNFWSDQIERMLQPKLVPSATDREAYYVRVHAEPRRPDRWYNAIWPQGPPLWFGERMRRDEAIWLTLSRVAEIGTHLDVGAPTAYMNLARDVVVKRGDPSNARPIPPPPLETP